MDNNEAILKFFIQFGDCKCYFKLNNGIHCQGWIEDVDNHSIKFLDCGPLASEEAILIEISDINFKSLCYWDENLKKWVDY